MCGNGRDAPIPAIHATAIEPRGSTLIGHSSRPPTSGGRDQKRTIRFDLAFRETFSA
jgi:hypothetical protein